MSQYVLTFGHELLYDKNGSLSGADTVKLDQIRVVKVPVIKTCIHKHQISTRNMVYKIYIHVYTVMYHVYVRNVYRDNK